MVNSTTIKDRFLFLFSDLLVLAKPLQPSEGDNQATLPTLDWTFAVKSVIEIDNLKLTMPKVERRHTPTQTPLMAMFIKEFAYNPRTAINNVITKSGLPQTPTTIAQFLQQTPELDRQQLSDYLFNDQHDGQILRAYIHLEKLAGVSIESALRSLLLELRFPRRREPLQNLLFVFAQRWTEMNRGLIKDTFSSQLAMDLIYTILSLNDALHSHHTTTPGFFSASNPTLSSTEFVKVFRALDRNVVLSDRTLLRIYGSISTDAVQQAMAPTIVTFERTQQPVDSAPRAL